ncbi:hypothetical protein ISN45_At04g006470 [Arabidopsis thaliana x Arabidopsis arenosa]|uniref:Uncharacterized protein n=2 Tax=Arabidopsis TaxID=3701 RepID=A0A8T2EB44_ARASU|nr:hypothetical protein ISN45_At04g006470 [Arabidopsis thaliana x Arabidopsis arenosa]KAG7619700.1 hypothetical protein ISN44_As04g006170 [Arabidopsis suecica]
MRGVLEIRLAAALDIKNAAEQEKQEKEGLHARHLLNKKRSWKKLSKNQSFYSKRLKKIPSCESSLWIMVGLLIPYM